MSDKSKDFDATRRLLLGAALTGLLAGAVGTAEARSADDFGNGTHAVAERPAGTPSFAPGAGRLASGDRLGASAICRRSCYRGCFYRS